MSIAAQTIALDDLAKALGRDATWLKANWRRLHRDHALPRALPGSPGSNLRWSRLALEAWIEASGQLPTDDTPAAQDMIDRARARLHQQMGVGT